ncbi:hypothetical protein [uncultured Dysosmobacter sp.]|uniref:hypothetical protein n=1 Tax=uncultured Dysosmobacter sp. TaxID=2591384 RepID=UPI002609ADDE|nr:hypothetical protein [uncultured Dysosmobacter sp.]
MRGAERGYAPTRYRGRKPRGGPSPDAVMLLMILALITVMSMTMRLSGRLTGMTAREQLYHAICVEEA